MGRWRVYRRVCAGLAAVLGLGCLTASDRPLVVRKPVMYAYATTSEVVVMRGTVVVSRVPAKRILRYFGVFWTRDNRYVTAIEDSDTNPDDASQRRLIAIDAIAGTSRRLPCPYCLSQAPIGGSLVLANQEREEDLGGTANSILRFDLAATQPPVHLPTNLPNLEHGAFLGGASQEALLFGENIGAHEEDYFLVNAQGRGRQVGKRLYDGRIDNTGKSYLRGVRSASVLQLASGAVSYAIPAEAARQDGGCGGLGEIFVANPNQELFNVDTSAFIPPANTHGFDSTFMVNDLWWAGDGQLHATVLSGVCDNTPSFTTPPTEWRLANGKWSRVSAERVLSAKQLDASTKAIVAYDDKTYGAGPLYLDEEGLRTKIADKVIQVAAPTAPTDQTAMASPSDMCPLSLGHCVGTRMADIDGDSKPDNIGVTATQTDSYPSGRIAIHVVFGSGKRLDQTTVTDTLVSQGGFLGAADVNGDGRGDLFVVTGQGAHSYTITVFQYVQGQLQPVSGDYGGSLGIDSSLASDSGFSCETGSDGVVRLVTWGVGLYSDTTPPTYQGDEDVYESKDGALRKVSGHKVVYLADQTGGYPSPPKAVNDRVGAHCVGLSRFP
jgi:hypothetical protein